MKIPTQEELQDLALTFNKEITLPLIRAGFDQYNVFNILNIGRQELRHSDFLAFLFDPSKSGYIGQQFLRNFLTLLAKDRTKELDFFDMLYGNIDKVNVYREVAVKDGRIDILIDLEIAKDKAQKIVIAIENKVDSDQHDNQLEKYKNFLYGERYKNYTKIMLYLTPDKAQSGYDEWVEIDYGFIYTTLCRVEIETADNTIKTLIDDYKKLIWSEFEMNNNESELRKKALEIYKSNQKVLDFIYDSKPDWIKETSKILCKLLEQKGATIVIENSKGDLVESKKKDPVNIMFRIDKLANYPSYYFQICVDELSLLFINNSGRRQIPKQWLCGDRQNSLETSENFQKLVLTNIAFLEESCQQIIDKIFEHNIPQAIGTLANLG